MTNSVLKRAVPLDEQPERYQNGQVRLHALPVPWRQVPSLKLYGDHFHCFGCGRTGTWWTSRRACSDAQKRRRRGGSWRTSAKVRRTARARGLQARNSHAAGRRLRRGRWAKEAQGRIRRGLQARQWTGYLLEVGASGTERGESSGRPRV